MKSLIEKTSKIELLPNSLNLPFVESLYADYARDPNSVAPEWRRYFEIWESADAAPPPRMESDVRAAETLAPAERLNGDGETEPSSERMSHLQDRVDQLIRAYRISGHMVAKIDPLDMPRPRPAELDPQSYGLTEADMGRKFSCQTLHPEAPLSLREIIQRLHNTYCRSIGVEYMHIDDLNVRRWLQARMERCENRIEINRKQQLRIYTRLTDAVMFEGFIRRKFVGAKSFSLEGSESLIPLLDLAIEKAGEQGIEEIVLGMAHRGRLNVLANIMGKSPRQIFREFADAESRHYTGRGDVKYHLGYSSDWRTAAGQVIHLSLGFNPSHLEFVSPVVLGRLRAKLDRVGDSEHRRGLAVIIHGDAATVGQGVVQETLNLSLLEAYSVGGALHIIVNNQIGFTTSPDEGRSCRYCTDVAKMLQVPIFHVNGEDPEAVAQTVKLAMEFRREFQRDVVIDMYGYRRLGHNESDEPSFTHPTMYRAIEQRKPVREAYLEHLLQLEGLTREEADEIAARRRDLLEKELTEARSPKYQRPQESLGRVWAQYHGGPEWEVADVDTGVEKKKLAQWLEALAVTPKDFHPHPKITKLLENRRGMAREEQPLDWAAGEALAFGSLVCEGYRVRFSGQDSRRGTFSHRHAVLHDYERGQPYIPLAHLAPKQAPMEIYNSPLSEVAVLGFEYGYSLDYPHGLVMWEAQFGDFWNVAQVIVDQFIASAEDKWRRLSGLVLLLPHGFEGQGPEHSSARLERFLMLAAEDNIQVVVPTTPAQFFHCLRRQVIRPWRKPLVVMTPKSLLRHPKVISRLDDLATGRFQRILPDQPQRPASSVTRVLLCTGKIYYELAQHREEHKRDDVAILRLEQLYPLDANRVLDALRAYRRGTPIFWVQEEPENMGAWRYLVARFLGPRGLPFDGIFRPASASPATGSAKAHQVEQTQIIEAAFNKT